MSLKRTLFSGAFWNLLNLLVSGAAGFVLLPLMLRQLGSAGVGILSILSLFSLSGFGQILELGFQTATSKYVAEYRAQGADDKIRRLVATLTQFYGFVGGSFGLLGYMAAERIASLVGIVGPQQAEFIVCLHVLFLSFLFTLPYLALSGVLTGYHLFKQAKRIELLGHVVRLIGTLVLLFNGGTVGDIFVFQIAVQFFQFLAAVSSAIRVLPSGTLPGRFSWTMLRAVSSLSSMLLIGRICSITFKQTDRLLLASFFSPAIVGQYEAATKMPYLVKGTVGTATDVLLPAVSFMDSGDFDRIRRLFYRSFRWQMSIMIPPALALIAFAEEVLHYWLGPEYVQLAGALRLATVSVVMVPIQNVGSNFLVGLHRGVGESAVSNIVTSLINLGLTIYLAPRYGILGALTATVVSGLISVCWHYWIFRRELGISIHTTAVEVGRLLSFGGVGVFVLLFVKERPMTLAASLALGAGFLVSYGFAILWRVFDDSDRKTLRQMLPAPLARFLVR